MTRQRCHIMSYIYLGAAVQLLLILSALRVTAVSALQATQSKTSDALRRARARRASTARGHFVDLVSARSSLFDVAASIAEEENTVAPAFARACVDDLSKLAAARLSLTSALGDGGSHYEGEAGRVAAAVAATLGDWRVETEEMPDEPFLIDAVVARDAGSAAAVLAVVDEVARAASQGRVGVGAVVDRGRAAVLIDGEGKRALVSLAQAPLAAPCGDAPKAHPSLRAGALLLKGLSGAAPARSPGPRRPRSSRWTATRRPTTRRARSGRPPPRRPRPPSPLKRRRRCRSRLKRGPRARPTPRRRSWPTNEAPRIHSGQDSRAHRGVAACRLPRNSPRNPWPGRTNRAWTCTAAASAPRTAWMSWGAARVRPRASLRSASMTVAGTAGVSVAASARGPARSWVPSAPRWAPGIGVGDTRRPPPSLDTARPAGRRLRRRRPSARACRRGSTPLPESAHRTRRTSLPQLWLLRGVARLPAAWRCRNRCAATNRRAVCNRWHNRQNVQRTVLACTSCAAGPFDLAGVGLELLRYAHFSS